MDSTNLVQDVEKVLPQIEPESFEETIEINLNVPKKSHGERKSAAYPETP